MGDTCNICFEVCSQPAVIDGCQHVFCLKCIEQWARVRNTCPICQNRFTTVRVANRTIHFEKTEIQLSKEDNFEGLDSTFLVGELSRLGDQAARLISHPSLQRSALAHYPPILSQASERCQNLAVYCNTARTTPEDLRTMLVEAHQIRDLVEAAAAGRTCELAWCAPCVTEEEAPWDDGDDDYDDYDCDPCSYEGYSASRVG